ncbi:hypothetical protein CsatB_019013 [Cannabis sativa]|uniref:RING-type E3 ubiquitin transferase n=1 Tax=Cannabis sativa TaxID=3483 RepID=A0A7J6H1H8_CANSA|nr:hypothetical protein G4B88_012640 [Cannabis sativa]
MASEADASEFSSLFERMVRNRDFSLFLPFIFGLPNGVVQNPDSQDQDRENDSVPTSGGDGDRVILINPFTQGMVVFDGVSSFDSLLRDLGNKDGQPPASKASIEAMPSVVISDDDDDGETGECVICLDEFQAGGVAKEMPCKHRFHGDCIGKWLKLHGSCPVCRFKMPEEQEDMRKKRDQEEEEEEGGSRDGRRREIWISFSIRSRSSENSSNQTPSNDSDVEGSDASSNPVVDHE